MAVAMAVTIENRKKKVKHFLSIDTNGEIGVYILIIPSICDLFNLDFSKLFIFYKFSHINNLLITRFLQNLVFKDAKVIDKLQVKFWQFSRY